MSLYGWWPLHEQSGQANDLSGNENHGTVNGPTQKVVGRGGLTAYSFDGSDDDVRLGSSNLLYSSPLSISLWVYTRSLGDNVFFGLSDFRISIAHERVNTNGYEFNLYDGNSYDSVTSGNSTTDTWFHLVGVYNSDNSIEFYIDSVSQGSNSGNGGMSDTSNGDTIGSHRNSSHVDAIISDVRLYNRALTPQEIRTLYEWGSGDHAIPPGNDDGGVGYYNFNSSNANDQWGSNDGTVNGATYQTSGGPREDGAYNFDGSDDYISFSTLPSTITKSSNFTTSCWVKPDSPGSADQRIFMHSNGSDDRYGMEIESNVMRTGIYDGSSYIGASSGGVPVGGAWYHFVNTWDSSNNTLTLYINTELQTGSTTPSTGANQDFRLGTDVGGNNFYSGIIDEARVYNRILDDTEIQELYQYGTLGRDMRQLTVSAI